MKKILKSNYEIIPEKQLMIELLDGIVTPGSIIHFKKIQLSDKQFNPSYNAIGDITNTSFDVATSQINAFVNFLRSNNDSFIVNKSAIILSTVNQQAYVNLFNTFKDQFPQSLKICTSLAEAATWVDRTDDLEFIQDRLNYLKKNLKFEWIFESEY